MAEQGLIRHGAALHQGHQRNPHHHGDEGEHRLQERPGQPRAPRAGHRGRVRLRAGVGHAGDGRVQEPPAYVAAQKQAAATAKRQQLPIVDLLRHHP